MAWFKLSVIVVSQLFASCLNKGKKESLHAKYAVYFKQCKKIIFLEELNSNDKWFDRGDV